MPVADVQVVINAFPSERLLVLRERAAGTYYASAYFMAKITAETATQLPIPIIFSAIVYWLVGLQPTASKFFIFTAFMLLCNLAGKLQLCCYYRHSAQTVTCSFVLVRALPATGVQYSARPALLVLSPKARLPHRLVTCKPASLHAGTGDAHAGKNVMSTFTHQDAGS